QGQAALDGVFEKTYGVIRATFEQMLRDEVHKLSGTRQGGRNIERLDVASVDLAAAPRLVIEPISTGVRRILFFSVGHSKYGGERVRLEVPRNDRGWNVGLTGRIDGKDVTIAL